MSQRYIGDNEIIICLDGLRVVRKVDLPMDTHDDNMLHGIEYQYYDGHRATSRYKDEKARDKMYEDLKAILCLVEPGTEITKMEIDNAGIKGDIVKLIGYVAENINDIDKLKEHTR